MKHDQFLYLFRCCIYNICFPLRCKFFPAVKIYYYILSFICWVMTAFYDSLICVEMRSLISFTQFLEFHRKLEFNSLCWFTYAFRKMLQMSMHWILIIVLARKPVVSNSDSKFETHIMEIIFYWWDLFDRFSTKDDFKLFLFNQLN